IREQHDWCARTANYAFQSRVTDVDASMLLQSHLPLFTAYRARLPCRAHHLPRDPTLLPKLPKRGAGTPLTTAVRFSGRSFLSLAKTGLHPRQEMDPAELESHDRLHDRLLCEMQSVTIRARLD